MHEKLKEVVAAYGAIGADEVIYLTKHPHLMPALLSARPLISEVLPDKTVYGAESYTRVENALRTYLCTTCPRLSCRLRTVGKAEAEQALLA